MDDSQKQNWWPDPHDPSDNPGNTFRETSGNPLDSGDPVHSYNDPYGGSGYRQQRQSPSPFSTASLVMGILSIVLICCGVSYIFGSLGIIFAILSRKDRRMETQASIGLGLSIAGSIIGILMLIVFLVGNTSYQTIIQQQEFYDLEDYLQKNDDSYENFDHDDFDHDVFFDDFEIHGTDSACQVILPPSATL